MYIANKLVARCLAIATCMVLWSVAVTSSQAKTPDGKPPAVESVCDGLSGSLWGLCVAYCEAMDCTDPNQHASDKACDRVFANYMKKSESEFPPCFMLDDDDDGGR